MGVVFDGYRVLSEELKLSRWFIPVLDILYWIAATIIVFQVLSASNEGEVRIYVFIGLLIGVCLYHWLLSRIVVRTVHAMIRAVKATARFAARSFMLLVVRPLQMLYKLTKLLLAFLLTFTIFLFRIVLQLVRPLWLLLWWMLRPIARPLAKWMNRLAGPIVHRLRLHERKQAIASWAATWWRRLFRRKKAE